ncbi:MAG: PEP-CTERM sorting domain-containing protein [Kiritimatiellales bacterium]|jgi:hypothetical protein
MKKIIMMFALAMAATSFATVSVNMDLMTLNDASDVAIKEGIKFLVYVDKDNDGINGLNLSNYADLNSLWVNAAAANTGSFLWDADDAIIFNGASAGWGSEGFFSLGSANGGLNAMFNLGNGIDQNDGVYAMWFAELAGNAATPAGITEVGFYTDSNWALPGDTGTLEASDYGLNQSAITVQAIPEPATALLVAIGGGMAYVLRRKQNILA